MLLISVKKARKTPPPESQVLDDVQTLWEKTQEPKMLETDSFVSRFPVDHVNNTEENLLFDDAKSSSKQDQNSWLGVVVSHHSFVPNQRHFEFITNYDMVLLLRLRSSRGVVWAVLILFGLMPK